MKGDREGKLVCSELFPFISIGRSPPSSRSGSEGEMGHDGECAGSAYEREHDGSHRERIAAYTLEKVCAAVFMLDRKKLELLMSVVLVLCACILAARGWEQASGDRIKAGEGKTVVVIDAGHGAGNPQKEGGLS